MKEGTTQLRALEMFGITIQISRTLGVILERTTNHMICFEHKLNVVRLITCKDAMISNLLIRLDLSKKMFEHQLNPSQLKGST